MSNNQDQIKTIYDKLEALLKKHEDYTREIYHLKNEIEFLRNNPPPKDAENKNQEDPKITEQILSEPFEKQFDHIDPNEFKSDDYEASASKITSSKPKNSPLYRIGLEKFIGENLINKIGIIITIIGVAIGAKYSIENNLISPVTRIILGYIAGLILLVLGIKLKEKYESYSAVLVSGSITILYFITYFSYSLYNLMPQIAAFGLMVIFTVLAVYAAIKYNRAIIAHIGLVGAYAVPFLLSDGSGKITILFSYISIINIGILFIAFKKYWKNLYYASFGLTWIMFASWYLDQYHADEHFVLALLFLFVIFSIFYLTHIIYKIIQLEKYGFSDILLLMLNAFILYGLGYAILADHESGKHFLGLFTLLNALIHFMVSVIFYRRTAADRNFFYLILGLVIVFITVAIPVQLDGNWVTILWAGQAALLFWIGRTKKVSVYEKISYALMFLAFLSIVQDWNTEYTVQALDSDISRLTPLINIYFLTSLLFIAAFGLINKINYDPQFSISLNLGKQFSKIMAIAIPGILILVVYLAFYMEILYYWNLRIYDLGIDLQSVENGNMNLYYNDLKSFKTIWTLNYTLFFMSLLGFINIRKINNIKLGTINFWITGIVVVFFLITGLLELSELRNSYLDQNENGEYQIDIFNLLIRYISLIFLGLTFVCSKLFLKKYEESRFVKIGFEIFVYLTILWVCSSELIHWLDIGKSSQSYKLGLSIFWGFYALLLIVLGIWKNKAYLRIASFALFAVILLKLFFYDISDMNTIAKTVVFVSIGILLLIVSFLYNKFKNSIK